MESVRSTRSPTAVGLREGSEGPSVVELQLYLARFGYLNMEDTGPFEAVRALTSIDDYEPGRFDKTTLFAVRAYQDFHGLPPTGEFDDATAAHMAIPRCGFVDIWDDRVSAGFVAQGNRWPGNHLRYAFQNFTPDLTQLEVRTAIAAAFVLWSGSTPLTFAEVDIDENPDIVIRFVAGNHGDGVGNAFDGMGGVLAHAFYPPPNGGAIAGDAHFDEAETWSVAIPVPPARFDLVTLATHEFGHSLGLEHSGVPGAIMRPTFAPGAAQRFLHEDDIDGIQSIYGIGTTVPLVRELRRAVARAQVLAAGLVPKFTGSIDSQAWVGSQFPRGGTRVARGSRVTLQLRTGPIP